MTRDQIIKAINKLADNAVLKMDRSLQPTQRKMLKEVETLIRGLDYTGDKISVTVKNMRLIGNIEGKLRRIVLNSNYEKDVKAFIKAFSQITTLQNLYLRQTIKDFKIKPVLNQIKYQSVQATIDSLTENGLDANVIQPVMRALRTNMTTGGTFRQIMDQVRESIVSTPAGEGTLSRYVKQITTDSLNQYSRNYLQLATRNSGLEWFQYTGSNIKTTRCFCHAMTKKRYFHISEIPDLIKGEFEEFKEKKCGINDKTNLPDGMIPGTNASNFLINLGGYNCGHRAIPVIASLVPVNIREKIKSPN